MILIRALISIMILQLSLVIVVSMKLIDLSVIKVMGSFKLPNKEIIQSMFLSRSKLEVLEDDNSNSNSNNNVNNDNSNDDERSSVILCDVLPILIQDSKGKILMKDIVTNSNSNEASKSIPYRDSVQSLILNRDGGLYDNLPYAFKKGPSKKNLFDFFSNVNSKVDTKKTNTKFEINAYSSFLKGVEQQLDAKLTGLFIEVSDQISSSSVSLGGACIFAKTNDANDWILNQYNTLLPDIATTDEGIDDDDIYNSPAVVVYCAIDEIIGLSCGTGMKIFIAEELFDATAVDARLNKDNMEGGKRSMTISAPIFGDSKDRNNYDALADNENRMADLAWEIYDPMRFIKMSDVEKRSILKASGVKRLPRPREGKSSLDTALINIMDDAVRKEVLRLSDTDSPQSFTSTPRQEVLRKIGEALSEGDLDKAEELRQSFIVMTNRLADPTQAQGSYDPYLDQDDWYMKERKKAMRPKS